MLPLYDKLLKKYGHQGWWPIRGKYHPGDFSYPKDDAQRFEICVGAILTQNTSWKNVEKAIESLREKGALSPEKISTMNLLSLGSLIKSSGYFNQKAKKLKYFAKYYLNLKGKTPSREDLLSLWGIGPETADSILLYAYHQPHFVIDTYTKRFADSDLPYDDLKEMFEQAVPRDYRIYQEFHALIVKHAKS